MLLVFFFTSIYFFFSFGVVGGVGGVEILISCPLGPIVAPSATSRFPHLLIFLCVCALPPTFLCVCVLRLCMLGRP